MYRRNSSAKAFTIRSTVRRIRKKRVAILRQLVGSGRYAVDSRRLAKAVIIDASVHVRQ